MSLGTFLGKYLGLSVVIMRLSLSCGISCLIPGIRYYDRPHSVALWYGILTSECRTNRYVLSGRHVLHGCQLPIIHHVYYFLLCSLSGSEKESHNVDVKTIDSETILTWIFLVPVHDTHPLVYCQIVGLVIA